MAIGSLSFFIVVVVVVAVAVAQLLPVALASVVVRECLWLLRKDGLGNRFEEYMNLGDRWCFHDNDVDEGNHSATAKRYFNCTISYCLLYTSPSPRDRG